MGLATVAIVVSARLRDRGVFGFAELGIGIAAPILLVFLRFLQGFLAVGGEWAGATLLTAEYAPPGKRELYAMFPQLGPAFAFFLSSLTFLIASLTPARPVRPSSIASWRILILSFALVVGLWVRLAVAETLLVFRDAQQRKAIGAATD